MIVLSMQRSDITVKISLIHLYEKHIMTKNRINTSQRCP